MSVRSHKNNETAYHFTKDKCRQDIDYNKSHFFRKVHFDVYTANDGLSNAVTFPSYNGLFNPPAHTQSSNKILMQRLPHGLDLFSSNFKGVNSSNNTASVSLYFKNNSENTITDFNFNLIGAKTLTSDTSSHTILNPGDIVTCEITFVPEYSFLYAGAIISNIVQNIHVQYSVSHPNQSDITNINITRPIGYTEYTGSDLISNNDFANHILFKMEESNNPDNFYELYRSNFDMISRCINPNDSSVQNIANISFSPMNNELQNLYNIFLTFYETFGLTYKSIEEDPNEQGSSTSTNSSSENSEMYYFAYDTDVQSPAETIYFGGGDCEDFSILFTSTALAMGIEARVALIPEHAFMIFAIDNPPEDFPENLTLDYSEEGDPPDRVWICFETTVDDPDRFLESLYIAKENYDKAKAENKLYIVSQADESLTYQSPLSTLQVRQLESDDD